MIKIPNLLPLSSAVTVPNETLRPESKILLWSVALLGGCQPTSSPEMTVSLLLLTARKDRLAGPYLGGKTKPLFVDCLADLEPED